jgi:peptidoglycan/LPS O-acetylase OafA/YrhL
MRSCGEAELRDSRYLPIVVDACCEMQGEVFPTVSMLVQVPTEEPTRLSAIQDQSHRPLYYPWFDWLRLLLACVVLFGHEGLIGWRNAGNFSVQVFFALSGWLIGGQLAVLPRRELPRFYFNRALRIWGPYFLAVSILTATSLARDHITKQWVETVFYDFTSVFNLFGLGQYKKAMPLDGTGGHFWSVNAEEQFYLLAPLILVLIPGRYGRRVITWVCIALIAWASKCYASIVFGVLAAVLAHRFGDFYTHRISRIASGLIVTLSVIGFIKHADYDLVAPVCALSLVLLLAIRGKRHPGGALAGGISYPLYLNAWIAVFTVNAIFKHFGFKNVIVHETLVLILSISLATLLYWSFDRRLLERRNQLYSPKIARVTMFVAYGVVGVGIVGGLLLLSRR